MVTIRSYVDAVGAGASTKYSETSIPNEKGKYFNTSLLQYQKMDAALKIVDDALNKAGKSNSNR
ncbi:MAG: hypothetical protein ACXWZE_11715 [Candidatus Binatia bacterium]